jgi:FtsH-binding integral membrane protein
VEDRNIIYEDDGSGFSHKTNNNVTSSSTWRAIAKTYLYMFVAVLVSALTCVGLYFIFNAALGSNPTEEEMLKAGNTYLALLIISGVGSIIMMFVTQLVTIKAKRGGLICLLIYSVLMGILISGTMLTIMVESQDIGSFVSTIGWAFVGTAGMFGVMTLYGYLAKEKASALWYGIIGLLFGILFITLMNIFLRSETLYYFIGYAYIALVLLYVGYDTWLLKRHAESGTLTDNWAVYYALQLYTDFIYLFIRLAIIIARSKES